MKNLFWPILFVLIIVETIAMALIENSVKLHTQHYIFGIFMYAVVSYLFYNLLVNSDKSGASANAIWNCSTTIALSLLSVFYFRETLDLNKKVGIFLAVLSILFMESVIVL